MRRANAPLLHRVLFARACNMRGARCHPVAVLAQHPVIEAVPKEGSSSCRMVPLLWAGRELSQRSPGPTATGDTVFLAAECPGRSGSSRFGPQGGARLCDHVAEIDPYLP